MDFLCRDLLTASRAPATRLKYATAWRHFARFGHLLSLPSLWLEPCAVSDLGCRQRYGALLARFAAFLAMGGVGASTVAKYLGHVRSLHHERFGVEFLSGLVQVDRVLDGLANRERLRPTAASGRKAPFTWGMFQQVAPRLVESPLLADRELVTVIAVGIAFLLRASELLPDGLTHHHLRRKDVISARSPMGSPLGLPSTSDPRRCTSRGSPGPWRARPTRLVLCASCGVGIRGLGGTSAWMTHCSLP